jgi:hypothetical protein
MSTILPDKVRAIKGISTLQKHPFITYQDKSLVFHYGVILPYNLQARLTEQNSVSLKQLVAPLAGSVSFPCPPPVCSKERPIELTPLKIERFPLPLSLAESISAAESVETCCVADATPRGRSRQRNDTDAIRQRI